MRRSVHTSVTKDRTASEGGGCQTALPSQRPSFDVRAGSVPCRDSSRQGARGPGTQVNPEFRRLWGGLIESPDKARLNRAETLWSADSRA